MNIRYRKYIFPEIDIDSIAKYRKNMESAQHIHVQEKQNLWWNAMNNIQEDNLSTFSALVFGKICVCIRKRKFFFCMASSLDATEMQLL